MAKGNGEGAVVPRILAEIEKLQKSTEAHYRDTQQSLSRLARMIVAITDELEDHEQRLSALEGR